MILRPTDNDVLAIRQIDHAAFAAFLLENWSDHNFGNDPERERIIRATRDHDNGWRDADDDPQLDPATRLPIPFSAIDPLRATEIWRRGTQTYAAEDAWHVLLITHHAYSVYELGHKRDPLWKDFFTEFAQQRAELRGRLGLTHPEVERAYSYLRMADWFSLRFCMSEAFGRDKPEKYGGYTIRSDGNVYEFRPYPFVTRDLTYALPYARLRKQGYDSEAELHKALDYSDTMKIVLNPLPRSKR